MGIFRNYCAENTLACISKLFENLFLYKKYEKIMSDTYLTRKTLLRRLKSESDEKSWEEFAFYYENFIRSIINKMGISPSDFDDLSQQVMLKIWNSISKFDHTKKKGGFRNWIYTITRNTVLTFIEKNKRNISKTEDMFLDQTTQFVSPEVDAKVEDEWNKHLSVLAFEAISKKVSKTAMESFIAGVNKEPVEKTAERLGINVKTVYIYRHRIKTKLIDEISNLRDMLE